MTKRSVLCAMIWLAGASCVWGAEMDTLVCVDQGRLADACVGDRAAVKPGDGYVEIRGADKWLLANRGLEAGDFHITARLSVHGLKHSAARFSFDTGASSFGFEGNHGKIYVTGIFNQGKAGALTPPAEAGIVDGKPFLLEVVRTGKRLSVRIDGRTVHEAPVRSAPVDCFGFDPRRAAVRIEHFAARGAFQPSVYTTDFWSVWFHPKCRPVETPWHGPFLNLPDGRILTVVNDKPGKAVRANVSADDGKTWTPAGAITSPGQRFLIRDGNEDVLLLRTRRGTILCALLNIFDQKISWDYVRQEPKPDMKRFTWVARSLDGGATWRDARIVQKGYCGALRDMIETRDGQVVLVGQDVANNPGRNVSYTYVSADDGLSWTQSNVMDIGGRGDHAGSIEGTLEELRDGRLWILLRSYHGHFYECLSSDNGLTWTPPAPSKIKASGSPGLLRRLASGRLVLLWNRFAKGRPRRYGRREELSIAFSEDDGKTWTDPVILVRERGKRQSYPQVFERRPGELWISTWQGRQFFKIAERDFAGASAE